MLPLMQFLYRRAIPYVSTYLVPIVIVVYILAKASRAYLIPNFITVFIVGITDTMLRDDTPGWMKALVVVCHAPLLILPFVWRPTPVPHVLAGVTLLYLVAIATILFLPHWPYIMSRRQFVQFYTISIAGATLLLSQLPATRRIYRAKT